jgi:deoxyribodipyrimidine photolyase-related protein
MNVPPFPEGTAQEVRLVLGDQLNHAHPWFAHPQPEVVFLMAEMRSETDYALHHHSKVLGFFAAMRRFAEHLHQQGHRVAYLTILHPSNLHHPARNLQWARAHFNASTVRWQEPDEYRVDQLLRAAFPSEIPDPTHHFLTSRTAVADLFRGKKTFLMETFYRTMRQSTGLLMRGQQPEGGTWNLDAHNRKKWVPGTAIPPAPAFHHNLESLAEEMSRAGIQTMGTSSAADFPWPLTRTEALHLLHHFTTHLLPHFGTFQDALTHDDPYLFHSRLSMALNLKLIHPLEVCQAVEEAWRNRPTEIDLAQAEGFIRQIIGWREYIRGVYWARMPHMAHENFFGHERPLPRWYWTGQTRMKCLATAIGQSLELGYAHHIQRLMVTGNFALLAGVDPQAVHQWYLGIYVDAIEWVEMPNTLGMSQFADGGILATKPYVSSGSYIHKMGNHCGSCAYAVQESTGPGACPLNSLYWHFIHRHRPLLEKNRRMAMMYNVWDKMPPNKQADVLAQAETHLNHLELL